MLPPLPFQEFHPICNLRSFRPWSQSWDYPCKRGRVFYRRNQQSWAHHTTHLSIDEEKVPQSLSSCTCLLLTGEKKTLIHPHKNDQQMREVFPKRTKTWNSVPRCHLPIHHTFHGDKCIQLLRYVIFFFFFFFLLWN